MFDELLALPASQIASHFQQAHGLRRAKRRFAHPRHGHRAAPAPLLAVKFKLKPHVAQAGHGEQPEQAKDAGDAEQKDVGNFEKTRKILIAHLMKRDAGHG